MLLTHALALSASQFVHKKKSLRINTSMQLGLELTKQTYTRLEDNLIHHTGATDHRYAAGVLVHADAPSVNLQASFDF